MNNPHQPLVSTAGLQALGAKKDYDFGGIRPDLLEVFDNPFKKLLPEQGMQAVRIKAPEFTSLCPLTGQPDFATIVIDYCPDEKCVESKALKLYLGSYRMAGDFHESCAARIAKDLQDATQPYWIRVQGQFTPRGGIPFWPVVVLVDEKKVQGAVSLRQALILAALKL